MEREGIGGGWRMEEGRDGRGKMWREEVRLTIRSLVSRNVLSNNC